jgi:DNA-binding NtrC family response regulator
MKRRLLLVEDDEVFLRPLLRTLELKGYEVLPVPSGEEALETIKAEDVDVVLTDRRLPGMDGVELVRHIKADHPDLAVVVMTAYGTIESAVEAMRLGAEDYLVKPFEAAELLLVIRRAIEFQELKSANRRTIRRNQERFTFGNIQPTERSTIRFRVRTAFGTLTETGEVRATAWQSGLPGDKLVETAVIKLRQ